MVEERENQLRWRGGRDAHGRRPSWNSPLIPRAGVDQMRAAGARVPRCLGSDDDNVGRSSRRKDRRSCRHRHPAAPRPRAAVVCLLSSSKSSNPFAPVYLGD